jgi:hypothetical protein
MLPLLLLEIVLRDQFALPRLVWAQYGATA